MPDEQAQEMLKEVSDDRTLENRRGRRATSAEA